MPDRPKTMNKTEGLTYDWLLAQGYAPEDIVFQPRKSPDFFTADGKAWETKLARNGVVTFGPTQGVTLAGCDCTLLLFEDGDTEPALVAPVATLTIPGRHGKYTFAQTAPYTYAVFNIRLDEPLKNALEGLAANDDRSLNNYITRVLETHVRAEMERLGVDYDTRATPEA